MKQGMRAAAAALSLASASCSLFFGDRGAAESAAEASPPYAQSFSRIPEWVRPAVADYSRSAELRSAIDVLERREPVSAAIQLQSLRARERWGPEVSALHAWALVDADAAAEARRVALDGLQEHGGDQPSLHYALAVAEELGERHAEALASYERVLARAPLDPVLLRACARTALAAGRAGTALNHLAKLPDTLEGSDGLELARMRAAAYFGAGRHADAVALHERIALAYRDDFALQEFTASGAFAAAEAAGSPALRGRARALVAALAELDPQHAEAQWMLGRLAASLGDPAAAETALRRTLELAPARVDAAILLATLLDDGLRKDEARAILFESMRQPLSGEQVEAVQRRLLELENS